MYFCSFLSQFCDQDLEPCHKVKMHLKYKQAKIIIIITSNKKPKNNK